MSTLTVKCKQCGNVICEADREIHIGFQVEEAGGVYKLPFLFNGSSDPLYFCSTSCKDVYYEANIPKNEKVTNALNELKAEIPQMAKDTIEAATKFIDNLKSKK